MPRNTRQSSRHSAQNRRAALTLILPIRREKIDHANDCLEDNLNPIGRVYYAFSTTICTPASKAQEVGLGLGAQAGEARIRDVVTKAGFTRFRRAAETPFNLIYEIRP
jgi:hypothetical protein